MRGDVHAAAVASVLKTHGAEILFSIGTDVPDRQAFSFRIDQRGETATIHRNDSSDEINDGIDIVWARRVKLFDLPDMHPDDIDLADREFRLFLNGFWRASAASAVWINPWAARKLVNTKLVQLVAAKRCGFAISPTLASHDPEAIAEFVRAQGAQSVIFKTFRPTGWKEGDGRQFGTPTTLFDQRLLDEPDDLRLCPGIYQRFIDKAKEFRVTVMGDRVLCVVIVPADHPDSAIDWRIGQERGLKVLPYALPVEIEEKCRKIVGELGLAFGCIDLILGTDGQWYFLEINEMGQFLWIEKLCPDEHYLESFVQFIFSASGREKVPSGIRLEQVLNDPSYAEIMETTLGANSAR